MSVGNHIIMVRVLKGHGMPSKKAFLTAETLRVQSSRTPKSFLVFVVRIFVAGKENGKRSDEKI